MRPACQRPARPQGQQDGGYDGAVDVLWHVAARADRPGILAAGLLARRPGDSGLTGAEQMGQPAGIYAFLQAPDMRDYPGHDLWEIRDAGAGAAPDRLIPGAMRLAAGHVPARQLALAPPGYIDGMAITSPQHSRNQVAEALNSSCDDILSALEAPDEGVRDALNLLVNAALERLDDPHASLDGIIGRAYGISPGEEGPLQWAGR